MIYPIQTNMVALIILLIIYVAMRQNKPIALRNERYFFAMIFSVMGILLFDTATEVLNGLQGDFYYILHIVSLFFLFASSGIAVLFWILYTIDYMGVKPKKYIKIIYFIPAILLFLMALSSIFFDWFFRVDSENIYSRGDLFSYYTLLFIGYVISVLIFIVMNLKKTKRQDWVPLLTLPVFPTIGGVIQFFNYGVLLLWPMTALSLFIVFIFIQLKLIRVDYLTQLFNKHEFYRRIHMLNNHFKHQELGCMVCDIDRFKQINDTYGHYTGDLVLKELSKVFEQTFNHYNHFVARIGGDEFGFLFPVNNEFDFLSKLSELKTNLRDLNEKKMFDFELSISTGEGIYYKDVSTSLESFFKDLDVQMYKNKQKKALGHQE